MALIGGDIKYMEESYPRAKKPQKVIVLRGIYIHTHTHVCVCVCVCVNIYERERKS